jgi:hypothetical protein
MVLWRVRGAELVFWRYRRSDWLSRRESGGELPRRFWGEAIAVVLGGGLMGEACAWCRAASTLSSILLSCGLKLAECRRFARIGRRYRANDQNPKESRRMRLLRSQGPSSRPPGSVALAVSAENPGGRSRTDSKAPRLGRRDQQLWPVSRRSPADAAALIQRPLCKPPRSMAVTGIVENPGGCGCTDRKAPRAGHGDQCHWPVSQRILADAAALIARPLV